MLVVHGGFWAAGQRGEASLASRALAERGFTVFDVEYRIAPQPNWQTALGDVKCAIGWVKQHATTDDWNVDPKRIALLGRSAGAHLALMAAYTAAADDLPSSCPSGGAVVDTSVESVISLYGRRISPGPTPTRRTFTPPTAPRSCGHSWATRPSASQSVTGPCHRPSV